MSEATDHPGVIALPPLIMLAALAVSVALDFVLPIDLLPPALSLPSLAIGLLLIAVALAIAISGAIAFRRAGTNIEPTKPALVLVEDGPYRFTRNPMYVGLILMLAGIGVLGSVDWSIPMMIPLWLVLHHGVVLREERYLTDKFGEPYRAFLGRTRRWL